MAAESALFSGALPAPAAGSLPAVLYAPGASADAPCSLRFTEGFCRLARCSAEQARGFYAGGNPLEGICPEDREALVGFALPRNGEPDPKPFSCRLLLPGGGLLRIGVQLFPYQEDGRSCFCAVLSDLSEFSAREERLSQQLRSAQAFANSVSGVYMAVRRSNLTQNRVESITGTQPLTEMAGEPDYDASIGRLLGYIPSPADRELCASYYSRAALTAAFEAGRGSVTADYQLSAEDGSVRWVRSTIYLVRRPSTGDLIAFSTVRNISDEIMSEKLTARIVNLNYDTVAYCDLQTRKVYVRSSKDAADAALAGADYEAVIETALEKVDPKQSEEFRKLAELGRILRALETEPVCTFYYTRRGRRSDLPGAPQRQTKIDAFYLDEHRNLLVFLLTDVTEIFERDRENRQKMADALVAAKQASAAKSNFLSRMSHEIRTPLNAIIGMDAIAAQSIRDPERVADCVSKIGLSARYLLSLVNDILDMSRIESGKMLLKNDSFLFAEFIGGVNNIIYPQARAKGLDYECTVSSEVDDVYIGDEMKLQQILVNVLGNAVKFTAAGRITLDVSVLSHEKNQAKLRFVVNDTGCGIAEESLGRIFEAFEQADTSTTTVFGGTGLGLAITKNLAGLMGGSVGVRSIVGVGSEFTVDIPLTVDETVIRAPKLPLNLRNLHTLIVDDDLLVCEQTVAILKDIGMTGEWVTAGQEAVSRVRAKSADGSYYDFILIDWKMPDMDGIETTQRIRRIVGPDVTIIIISAYDWQSIEAEARAAGANLMISKPLLRTTLVSAFEKALGEEQEAELQKQEFDFTGRRILVAEDNELNAEIARTLLENRRFTVEAAANGIKALEKFAQSPVGWYDAILMDVRMPMMDGLQATINIRHWDKPDAKTIPIVAMTANAFDEDVEKSRAAGMNAHLSKPIDPELLYSTLYRLLNLSGQA